MDVIERQAWACIFPPRARNGTECSLWLNVTVKAGDGVGVFLPTIIVRSCCFSR